MWEHSWVLSVSSGMELLGWVLVGVPGGALVDTADGGTAFGSEGESS